MFAVQDAAQDEIFTDIPLRVRTEYPPKDTVHRVND